MNVSPRRLTAALAMALLSSMPLAAQLTLPGIRPAMEASIASNEIAGAVTAVVTREKPIHLDAVGLADVAAARPMTVDTVFWIASMTKPVTGAAVLMLQDEGKLNVDDPVAKYLPEFANLKTPSGRPADLTLTQLLTHTAGLGEASRSAEDAARTLADLVSIYLAAPMENEPGSTWRYSQSGLNTAARVVEVVSGQPFDQFLRDRLFAPLQMNETTFYPTDAQLARIAIPYNRNASTGGLEPVAFRHDLARRDRAPLANGGLYSTVQDYARFARMLLNGGELDGRRYLSPSAMRLLSTPQTGDLPTGFFQEAKWGNFGANYGWGIGTCVLRTPHSGVAETLSPGSFGHGGAWGTQAWIDPVKGVAYLLLVQRADFPNSDASEVRRDFQKAAANTLAPK